MFYDRQKFSFCIKLNSAPFFLGEVLAAERDMNSSYFINPINIVVTPAKRPSGELNFPRLLVALAIFKRPYQAYQFVVENSLYGHTSIRMESYSWLEWLALTRDTARTSLYLLVKSCYPSRSCE